MRIQKPISKLLGPVFCRSRESIEIDITYDCNLYCVNCNRSCRQAPDATHMTVSQIEKFIQESIQNEILWKKIRLTGGEPTLHPNLLEIIDRLTEYKRKHSRELKIQIITNNWGQKIKAVLQALPQEIEIPNRSKDSPLPHFYDFNMAPRDSFLFSFSDYMNGCQNIEICGMGLTPYGYYPCAISGAIDRVLGLDLGRKALPSRSDDMKDLL
ncbi:MAG: radical SAM protein [Candidatus Omnitrophica bacterium]|nr:radical SAM protein [Candidatus Omnitrophota bacterium]